MTTVSRSLFPDDLPPAERPEDRLKPGQPGKGWRREGTFWAFDCKDGTRAITGNGSTRVRFYPRRKG